MSKMFAAILVCCIVSLVAVALPYQVGSAFDSPLPTPPAFDSPLPTPTQIPLSVEVRSMIAHNFTLFDLLRNFLQSSR